MQIKALHVVGKGNLVEKIIWNFARFILAIKDNKNKQIRHLTQYIYIKKYFSLKQRQFKRISLSNLIAVTIANKFSALS
jgi:hypothetical protein